MTSYDSHRGSSSKESKMVNDSIDLTNNHTYIRWLISGYTFTILFFLDVIIVNPLENGEAALAFCGLFIIAAVSSFVTCFLSRLFDKKGPDIKKPALALIDLVWLLAGSFGVLLGLASLYNDSEGIISAILRNNNSSYMLNTAINASIIAEECRISKVTDAQTCQQIVTIPVALQGTAGHRFIKSFVEDVCPKFLPVAPGDLVLKREISKMCGQLIPISLQRTTVMSQIEGANRLIFRLGWALILCIAVGLRLAKSLADVFL